MHTAVSGINSEQFFEEPEPKEKTDAFGRKVIVKFADDGKTRAEEQRNEMVKLGN